LNALFFFLGNATDEIEHFYDNFSAQRHLNTSYGLTNWEISNNYLCFICFRCSSFGRTSHNKWCWLYINKKRACDAHKHT